MSDPLPPPRSSSIAPDTNRSDYDNHEHNTDTLPDHPNTTRRRSSIDKTEGKGVDGKQKRKRTSTKDQAVLEAEYKSNPKPNKAARSEIVKRVDLNEKEVQIWFQNRRQINRRKSRPLLPHEVAAFGIRGMGALSSDPIMSSSSQSSEDMNQDPEDQPDIRVIAPPRPVEKPETILIAEEQTVDKDEATLIDQALKAVQRSQATAITSPLQSTSQTTFGITSPERSALPVSEDAMNSLSSTPGFSTQRGDANSPLSTPPSSHIASFATPQISNTIEPTSCPERIESTGQTIPSLKVRLSMSLDGKAELIDAPISPMREFAARPCSAGPSFPHQRRILQRSQSAVQFDSSSRTSPDNRVTPFAPHLPSGRSRDARTWEFCCDPDARDELTTQAENESTGSAVAAISLLRSTSSSIMKTNANKRNAPAARQSGMQGKRMKLSRAQSSVARLQSSDKYASKPLQSEKGSGELMRSPSGDSDKENWIPGEANHPRRRPLPSSKPPNPPPAKTILGDNLKIMTHAGNLGASKVRRRKGVQTDPKVFEDEDDGGEEVQMFMRGEVSPGKKGDLDCIQGLLSLSQGNWR